ncbi:SMP-30/gluconolactonase/LRE family protein [Pendulispora brunnea]|uniref:SMP-30/gluconolactonase/LRE family protein n=1 Tax=Pendulispora brunnea TaxID=2905690 RepID=A0ABZ2KDL7_9BACT
MSSLGKSFFCLAFLALAACSSDDDGKENPPPLPPSVVASFDAAQGQLPEGIAFRDGSAYVGFAPLGIIARVNPATGAIQTFGKLPGPSSPTSGFMTGLAFDAQGSLYAALVSLTGDVKSGIYRVGKDGGDATLFAEHPDLKFPNGLEFDAGGRLWVTDSNKGAVFRIASDGTVSLFSDHALLAGQQGYCGPGTDSGFVIGANGIALGQNLVYVANTDKASIVEIAINADGTAGATRTVAGPNCELLGGADGLVRAPNGSLFVAANRLNQIARIEPNGTMALRGRGAPLDFPASLVISNDTLWITSFALANANAGTNPKPALLRSAF